jgi:hypothetical protein
MTDRTRRLVLFVLAILAGFGLAAGYGWLINPGGYADTTPATLRADYRADWVLMVSERFAADGDIDQAAASLEPLGDTPLRQVQGAIVTAQELGLSRVDIEKMARLAQALQFVAPRPTVTEAP